jgi:hypothetical protein
MVCCATSRASAALGAAEGGAEEAGADSDVDADNDVEVACAADPLPGVEAALAAAAAALTACTVSGDATRST